MTDEQGKTMTEPKKDEMHTGGETIKKNWRVLHNQYDIVLKKGEKLGKIPKKFLESLKKEEVI